VAERPEWQVEIDLRHRGEPRYGCAVRGCRGVPRFWGIYRYVTGRRGRVSLARRRLCEEHARRFAERHGVGQG
jgi:hypothetical protein